MLNMHERLIIDDVFFNRNWGVACRGRWAGPGLLVGWGCRLLGRRGWGRIAAAMLDCRLWVRHFSAKTRKKGVGEGFARDRSDA